MLWYTQGLMIVWPLIILVIFFCQTTQRAIVTSFVASWTLLPPILLDLSGLPDYSKASAGVVGVTLGVLLTRSDRLLAFRPRWFDLPVLGYCISSFPTAIVMGYGPYEGLSSVLDETVRWGIPYLIGRVYLADLAGARQLAFGIALGGLCYVPFCLIEIQHGPMLRAWIYGIPVNTESVEFGLRYGGYRPVVFLQTGLELGWWMCCATLCGSLLIVGRSTRRWLGLPGAPLAVVVALVTVGCKSTGALLQMFMGFAVILASRWIKKPALFWLLVSVPPVYCLARPLGLASSARIGSLFDRFFSADRLQSLLYRLYMEDQLISAAWQHSILGWTRNSGYNSVDASGHVMLITDGYWILVFCNSGFVGLALFNSMILLPTVLFLKKFPVRTWLSPQVAPLLALATILPLFMIDNLSNAMPSPIYVLAMGSLTGIAASRVPLNLATRPAQPEHDPNETHLLRAIAQQEQLVRGRPFGRHLSRLAALRVEHARFLAARGLGDLALAERTAAEALWLAAGSSTGSTTDELARAANANDLAWLLVVGPTADPLRTAEARGLAELALAVDPNRAPYWNTLGIVCYRQTDHHRAIHALSRSVSLDDEGGTAFDFYFLALANSALGYSTMTDGWLERAESWRFAHPELELALAAIRGEVDVALS